MFSKPLCMFGSAALLLVVAAPFAFSRKAQTRETKSQTEEPKATQQAQSGEPFVRITAVTENIVDSQDTVRIDLDRWSTDAERNQLPTVWNQALARAAAVAASGATHHGAAAAAGKDVVNPPKNVPPLQAAPLTPRGSLYAALEKMPNLGYIWSSSEVSGYNIKYAVEIPNPDGGERVILITDRKLGDYDGQWNFAGPGAAKQLVSTAAGYDAGSDGAPNQYDEYSIIELHLNSKGQGEGKISNGYTVAIDNTAKALELPTYGDLPVVLKNVQWRKSPESRKAS